MKIGCFVEAYNFDGKSERNALNKFKSTAESMGHTFDFIFKHDIPNIKNYDAIFIRATTDPGNSAYIASRFAEQAGLKVIDDPHSIRICSNKAILHDIFFKNNIPSPKSILFHGDYSDESLGNIFKTLGFPFVIKSPYTRFSSHVEKVENVSEFIEISKHLIRKANLLVLQEYIHSDFDWRVGILKNEILYLCKYCIPKGGWKVKSKINGKNIWGDTIPISRDKIAAELKDICINLSECVGDGLYGLDVKETDDGYKVIEINDNPSIYDGFEDAIDKDIYEKIISALV
ncbi:MAG: RimK family alpha-L-glutamate ligase [Candidatus Methanoperedens sp.]|nr:RimK family alpha-L-glutamate ligase [Candidatus Methanoperedens sp.]MCE8425288.1 RimK family alpha-L-glutamate ligase [Candidatus Methanoperedens sp.]MCE8427809.1 RimK family alpha-L-glutamate ligase [Candidatus Methanoperedens sp.]